MKVSFSLGLEGGIDTRAISDGSGTNRLVYAVFDQNGVRVDGIQAVDKSTTFPATEELTLVKNKSYKIAFWAQNSTCTAYTVDADAMTIGVNYAGLNNDETRDAFFKSIEVKVTGSTSIDVELKRALAQINVGVTAEDWEAAKNGGATITTSEAFIKKAASSLNVLTGATANLVDVEYTAAAIPAEDLVVEGNIYKWLSMSYILVGDGSANGAEQTVLDDLGFKFNYAGSAVEFKSGLTSVPVKRNCRTNIVGTLLTGKVDFNITIEEGYDKNYIYDGLYCVDGQNTYCIETPIALTYVADQINNGEWTDANFILGGDIDLSAITRAAVSNWTPMGTSEKPFTGTFDGNGHTIKNLTIIEQEAKEGKAYIGFFGYAKNATIKNVTFENVELNIPCLDIDHSQGHIGAVAGSLEGKDTIENVTVKGDIKVEATVTANGASRVAVVAGGNSYGDVIMKNVHVKANAGSYLKANNNVGALAGQLQGKSVFENCTSNIDVTGTKFFAGGIIGLAAGDQTFTNCHTTGNVTITQGREGKAHDHFRVGGIAGGWADGADKVCTLTGCSYTGVVSGKSFEGVEANPLDYMGYVGRGYALNGCQGSKVVIDGISFVQKYNTAAEAGVYIVNGVDSPEFVET
ncbi:MAG: hypothetical protein UHT92_09650, partial [Prevotella sp.]|nr:hypothetical protein [Prevotella sp.]